MWQNFSLPLAIEPKIGFSQFFLDAKLTIYIPDIVRLNSFLLSLWIRIHSEKNSSCVGFRRRYCRPRIVVELSSNSNYNIQIIGFSSSSGRVGIWCGFYVLLCALSTNASIPNRIEIKAASKRTLTSDGSRSAIHARTHTRKQFITRSDKKWCHYIEIAIMETCVQSN